MELENPLFLMALIIGLTFIIAGAWMSKYPPQKPNLLYGYRSKKSMKNEKNWALAQKYAGQLMIRLGLAYGFILIGLSFIVQDPNWGVGISIGLLALLCFIIFYLTEKKIKSQ